MGEGEGVGLAAEGVCGGGWRSCGGSGSNMSLCSSAPAEKPAVVQRPTRVRVQSTLLPSEPGGKSERALGGLLRLQEAWEGFGPELQLVAIAVGPEPQRPEALP